LNAEPVPAAAAPRSNADLFFTFTWLALQGFGGVLAVAQRELVERKRWLTREQFVELLSVAQVLPGPNIVNLSMMIGDRWFGVRGAMSALAGMLLMPLGVVLVLASLYGRYEQHPAVSGALHGMGVAAAGLVFATALKLLPTLRTNRLGLGTSLGLATATTLAVTLLQWPLLWVILGLGSGAIALAWRRLS
jgi:chromate transporter